MDKETLPRWGWLLLGLFVTALIANAFNIAVLGPAGVAQRYHVITVITSMAPVLIYVGIWYDEDRQQYWENTQSHVVGDLTFILLGAAIGSSLALVAIADLDLPIFVENVIAMAAGFMLSWGLFWWRNTDLYRDLDRR